MKLVNYLAIVAICLGFHSRSLAGSSTSSSEVSEWIDAQLSRSWTEQNITPAERASDSEWVRRVYLDLIGRIPSIHEVRMFVDSNEADKDRRLVDDLLTRGAFSQHWADVTLQALLPETASNRETEYITNRVNVWLRQFFREGRGYDHLARELINWQIAADDNDAPNGSLGGVYAIKKSKPEELAASTSRFFLGIRLECAQCHDHPFARWKRKEFWQFAAFYSGLERNAKFDGFQTPSRENPLVRTIKIEGTNETVEPVFLSSSTKPLLKDQSLREALAEWIVAKENPFFAKCAVNRVWAQLFGIGIVNPVDDMDIHNPPSHPAILDRLAREFADHDYDLRWLIGTIANSSAYRLSSNPPRDAEIPNKSFARMCVRTMTPQQFTKSFAQATGIGTVQQSEFLSVLSSGSENPAQSETSVVQVLAQMNSDVTGLAVNPRADNVLSAVTHYPALGIDDRIDVVYLATLSRHPSSEERIMAKELLQHYRDEMLGQTTISKLLSLPNLFLKTQSRPPIMKFEDQALSDLFWILLNSSEFTLNH